MLCAFGGTLRLLALYKCIIIIIITIIIIIIIVIIIVIIIIIIIIKPAPTQMIDGTEKPKSLRSLQNAQRVTTNLAVNT